MPHRKAPSPFFDTLAEMPNPYRQRVTSLKHLLEEEPAHALEDYQYASEFLYSYRGTTCTSPPSAMHGWCDGTRASPLQRAHAVRA